MHLHFERSWSSRTDCSVLSLTWMGKVPDELPEEDGWRLNRVNYYQDGWLASGNARGIVGVTFTTCHCRKTAEHPQRTNYNLRGHRSEVTLVKWNEPYQKLASCDSSGVIFVWIKYEGRWSIELINDRNTQVTDFAWSHDGRMALICYRDGFVLVGSVAGQRYWSSTLHLDRAAVLCGIWTPDDHQVLFGTSNGQILVNDMHGELVAQVTLNEDAAIVAMAWSCEKFKMEEADDDNRTAAASSGDASSVPPAQAPESKISVLAVCFSNGAIHVMKNYDDISPTIINTGLKDIKVEWSNSGEVLAVAGVDSESTDGDCRNRIHFYTDAGLLRFVAAIPYTQSPVTALTWGHNDKRLFVATGSVIHIGWVTRRMASLQLLSRLTLHRALRDEAAVHTLPLPRRLRALVANLFGQTVKCYLPEAHQLREFVSRPHHVRLHCTMVRHDTEDLVSGSATYTLFLEYLGGLVPLLKGKRASKLRPEFVIFDPEQPAGQAGNGRQGSSYGRSSPGLSADSGTMSTNLRDATVAAALTSDSDADEGCASSPGRRRRAARNAAAADAALAGDGISLSSRGGCGGAARRELLYTDELPEREKIVAVTSNLWGTKFKVLGLARWLPATLGTVTYRTSLLHLQPRQMTLLIKELQGPQPPTTSASAAASSSSSSSSRSLVLHNGTTAAAAGSAAGSAAQVVAGFSEDEDDDMCDPVASEESAAPIAPMTPKKRCGMGRSPGLPDPETGVLPADGDQAVACCAGRGGCGDEEFLTLETTAETGVQHLALRQAGRRPQGTTMSLHADALPGTSSSACQEEAASPSKKPQAELRPESRPGLRRGGGESAPHRSGAGPGAAGVRHLLDPVPRWADKAAELKYIDDEQPDEGVVGDVASVLLLSHHRNRSSIGPPNADFLVGDPRSRGCDARRLTLRSGSPAPQQQQSAHGVAQASSSSTGSRGCDDAAEVARALLAEKLQHRHNEEPACVCEASQNSSPATARKQRFVEENPFVCTTTSADCGGASLAIHAAGSSRGTAPGNSLSPQPALCSGASEDEGNRTTSRESTPSASPCRQPRRHRGSLPIPSAAGGGASTPGLGAVGAGDESGGSAPSSPALSRSIPSSPVSGRKSRQQQLRTLLYSPLLLRKVRGGRGQRSGAVLDSSDEEGGQSGEEVLSDGFRDLESMQKAHIRKKLKKRHGKVHQQEMLPPSKPPPMYREFVLHNKAPLWNEVSQVYQLDFGGRVTQESAKNFQIEFKGNQVMQFGRIDGNAYTLDFQYPFSALQAFSVALANVTQRLK
ncbi:tubby-related protein 4 [Dermacentor albipictus]|uniref:tubby-related protein 4 n=1 Tax=Dermacentor albipictus TaxID=60249 RepID=UPI0031FDC38D